MSIRLRKPRKTMTDAALAYAAIRDAPSVAALDAAIALLPGLSLSPLMLTGLTKLAAQRREKMLGGSP